MSIQQAIDQRRQMARAIHKLRREAVEEINRLIAFLDETDGDPDFEPEADNEPDVDAEPSLGSVHAINQLRWSAGCGDDREHGHDGREPDADREPEVAF